MSYKDLAYKRPKLGGRAKHVGFLGAGVAILGQSVKEDYYANEQKSQGDLPSGSVGIKSIRYNRYKPGKQIHEHSFSNNVNKLTVLDGSLQVTEVAYKFQGKGKPPKPGESVTAIYSEGESITPSKLKGGFYRYKFVNVTTEDVFTQEDLV